MAVQDGSTGPTPPPGNEARDYSKCPFCGTAVWSLPDHLRSGACDQAPYTEGVGS